MVHTLTLWTNDPDLAAWADGAGIDRVGLDLETLGKRERQEGLGTWISPHTLEDLDGIRPHVNRAELFVRINPLNDDSSAEVEALLNRGVEVIMLPNFTSVEEVAQILHLVNRRARVVPLVEHQAAIDTLTELAALGIEEFHVGLNDLSIEMGFSNRLALLAAPVADKIARNARAAGLSFGLGGLGRPMDETLPIPSDLVYAQHARLGASGALIARSFFWRTASADELTREVSRLRTRLDEWAQASPTALEAARALLERRTRLSVAV
jgi:HpcH/HpaI aldolase/citrate lyase family